MFDDIGMVSGFRDIINGESKIEQDSNGNVLSVTNDLEETIRFKYDVENRETKRIDALGNETSYEYDARDNQIKIIYP
ncbi:RHS repeat protein [Erysipelothrix sp. D19-032]